MGSTGLDGFRFIYQGNPSIFNQKATYAKDLRTCSTSLPTSTTLRTQFPQRALTVLTATAFKAYTARCWLIHSRHCHDLCIWQGLSRDWEVHTIALTYGCGSKPMGSHFGVGAPPILVYFSGDWDVHWGYGILTHGHMFASVSGQSFCAHTQGVGKR